LKLITLCVAAMFAGARPATAAVAPYTINMLTLLGTDGLGNTSSSAFRVNTSGISVGFAQKWNGNNNLGTRGHRWSGSQGLPTELGTLGADFQGKTSSVALGVTAAGGAVGSADKFVEFTNLGSRAVRWPAGQTTPVELGTLGTDASGFTESNAYGVNPAGDTVGAARKYSPTDANLGPRAVRWAVGQTAAAELANLGVDAQGFTESGANGMNAAGDSVGYARKYVGGVYLGARAVRWAAGQTAATELGTLGTSPTGSGQSSSFYINVAGIAVGYSEKYVGTKGQGSRAVFWPAGQTTPIELGVLFAGTPPGTPSSIAQCMNGAGDIVGSCTQYSGQTSLGSHATLWPAGLTQPVDLNTLIDPNSGWVLRNAYGINDDGVIVGIGELDIDGDGPLQPQSLAFHLTPVPEPSAIALIGLAGVALPRWRRVNRQSVPRTCQMH
jgi:hypothetical protein